MARCGQTNNEYFKNYELNYGVGELLTVGQMEKGNESTVRYAIWT